MQLSAASNKGDNAMARKMPKKAQAGFEGVDISYLGSKDESAEERTVESRRKLREMLESQIQAYIKNGGEIEQVDTHVAAEPSQKPQSSYGNRPI